MTVLIWVVIRIYCFFQVESVKGASDAMDTDDSNADEQHIKNVADK